MNPTQNLSGRSKLTRLADFLFEAGMLRKTPRTGYQFLGSGSENVAEHSFRAALVGYALAHMAGADPERTPSAVRAAPRTGRHRSMAPRSRRWRS